MGDNRLQPTDVSPQAQRRRATARSAVRREGAVVSALVGAYALLGIAFSVWASGSWVRRRPPADLQGSRRRHHAIDNDRGTLGPQEAPLTATRPPAGR